MSKIRSPLRKLDLLGEVERGHWEKMARETQLVADEVNDSVGSGDCSQGQDTDDSLAAYRGSSKSMCGLSSSKLPLSEEAFLRGTGASGDDASFRSWGASARSEFQDRSFVRDGGQIPAASKVSMRRSCRQCHYGLCETKHADIYTSCVRSGVALWRMIWDGGLKFGWVRLRISNTPPTPFWIAYARGANPRHILLLQGG